MEIPDGSISFGVEKETKTVKPNSYVPYILDNFFTIFPSKTINPTIGYGIGNEPIVVKNLASGYFDNKQPLSKKSIVWKTWKGISVPFIFGEENFPILTEENGQTIIHDDIFASAFYFLSGWQELTDTKRDYAGRFLFAQSIQKELNITDLPVVNIYFDILKTAIEQSYGIRLVSKFEKPMVCISHDIDEWATLWRQKAKKALKSGNIQTFSKTIWSRISGKYISESFLPIFELHKKFDFRTSFYFLPETKKTGTSTNADYDIKDEKIQNFIYHIEHSGNEVGLHGSFLVHQNQSKLSEEAQSLPQKPIGYRSHFLVFEMDKTPNQLEKESIQYDTSLGFPDQIGWRNSCSYPFYLFDHQNLRTSKVLEIPLAIMECTLFFKKYLGLNVDDATQKCLEYLQIGEKHGGIVSFLWHNSAFDGYLNPGWAAVLEKVIQNSIEKGIPILTGKEVLAMMQSNG